MANMVAIATLIDICEQKLIAKTLLDREKNINFLSFNGKSIYFFWRNFILLFAGSNVMIIPCNPELKKTKYQNKITKSPFWSTQGKAN